MATNRHISCGGLEVKRLEWEHNTLSGMSEVVTSDVYTLYIFEPPGFTFNKFICNAATLVENIKNGFIRTITLSGYSKQSLSWEIEY